MPLTGNVVLAIVMLVGRTVPGKKRQSLEGPARTNRARTRRRVVDQMSSLQVHAMRSQVAQLQRGFLAEALFDRATPLLDVLRRRVRVRTPRS